MEEQWQMLKEYLYEHIKGIENKSGCEDELSTYSEILHYMYELES